MEGEFSAISTPDLVDEITTLAGHLNAANARLPGGHRISADLRPHASSAPAEA